METTEKAPVTPETPKSTLSQFQLDALAEAEKELAALIKENESKKYLIDINKKDIEVLNSFILKDAPWKFTEALGIIEVEKEMKKAIKEGKLFISGVPIEAIYYYMSKVEGSGKNVNGEAFQTVETYLRILKGITQGLEKVKVDSEKLKQAEFTVAARREGIETA